MNDLVLPPLREELRLFPGPRRENGSPTWTLQDPLRQRFYRLGWREFEQLCRWHLGSAQQVVDRVGAETPLAVTLAEVGRFYEFLLREMLLSPHHEGVRQRLQQTLGSQPPWWKNAFKNYLFFRIPLFNPDDFLQHTLPWVTALFHPLVRWLLAALALLGLYLAGRQWEDFQHTFLYLFSWQGMGWFLLSLTLTKVAHELGHAYAAKYYGLNVPVMGVAFLVLWPVLYTDMSEGWKLANHRHRLVLAAAGVMVELGLALLATLLWSFTPDGPLRSALFLQATTSWVATLLVNLSPFMRFDGYFLLSDLLDVPNLQERAFALGRWSLRRLVLGHEEEPPEYFPPWRRRVLILYAWLTWAYRLLLFTGVALAVYHFFFKALGLILFMVEVGWFILLPISREVGVWWRMKQELTWNRHSGTLAVLLGVGVLLFILPWYNRIPLPALLQSAQEMALYTPAPARLVTMMVQEGQRVGAGESLMVLESPTLVFGRDQALAQLRQLEESLKRQVAVAELADQAVITQQEMDKALATYLGLQQQVARLHVQAAFAGVVRELAPGLQPGRWLNEETRLALLVADKGSVIEAFAAEEELERLAVGQPCTFRSDAPEMPTLPCVVEQVGLAAVRELNHPAMASLYGGPLAVDRQPPDRLLLRQATYPIRLAVAGEATPGQSWRGVAVVHGEGQALVTSLLRRVMGVMIRESGF